MKVALAAHDDVLRGAVETHGGWLFKHTGDGVCAAFASPRSAVDAAVTAQRALELPVRMGLATGEAELREADYFGAVLNRAARVMAAGHGGQILLADSTAGLLSGIDLLDLGPRRLRDLPAAVGMFQVRASGLRTDFPPLRTLDTTPGNLRPAPSSFIGRESALDAVATELKSHRLVTLTGVGGVGKTRLATEVATRLADEFPDGVWLFELAPVGDPAAVPDALAAILGITQQPGKSMSESVATALDGRVRLLVIDNCEHVLGAAGDLIEAILAHSATVKILATSREGLGVADEQLWPVPSLDVSAGIDSAAAALFLERARTVGPGPSPAVPDESAAIVLPTPRRDPIGDRAGSLADGVNERTRSTRPPGSPISVADRGTTRPGAPPNPAPRGCLVLRPARRRRETPAEPLLGVRRRFRPPKRLRHCDIRRYRRIRHPRSAGRAGAQVTAGSRSVQRANTILDAGDDPPIRRGTTRAQRRRRPGPGGTRQTLRGLRNRHARALGRSATARDLHLVHHRVRQPARRFSVGCRRRRPGQRGQARHARHLPRRLARTVRAHRLGRGAHRTGARGQPSAPSAAVRAGRAVLRRGASRRRFRISRSQPAINGQRGFRPRSLREPNLGRHRVHGGGSPPALDRRMPRGDRTRAGPAHDYPRVSGFGAQFLRRRRRHEGGSGRPARRGRGHHQSDYGMLRAIRAWSCAPQQ
jgi:hypothetical protein